MALAENELKVKNLHEEMITRGEKCIVEQFPERINKLRELLKIPELCNHEKDLKTSLMYIHGNLIIDDNIPSNLSEMIEDSLLTMPSNKYITQVLDILKPYILQLFDDCADLKLWAILALPKVENGEDYKQLSVSQDVLLKIDQAEAVAKKSLDSICKYYFYRGMLLTKFMKEPEVEYHRCSIEELDEKRYWLTIETIHNLLNWYLTCHNEFINFIKSSSS